VAATNTGPSAPYSQEDIDRVLTAVIAWSGNVAAALRYIKAEGYRTPEGNTVMKWMRTVHWERYEQLRDQWSQKVETTVANDMRDAAREALDVQRLAVEKARERLEAGRDDDPAKSAASLARVAQSNTDKLLSLTGRPTQITESRNAEEILRSLVARGVLQLPDEPVALEAGSDE
jgi:hypothetical protein